MKLTDEDKALLVDGILDKMRNLIIDYQLSRRELTPAELLADLNHSVFRLATVLGDTE